MSSEKSKLPTTGTQKNLETRGTLSRMMQHTLLSWQLAVSLSLQAALLLGATWQEYKGLVAKDGAGGHGVAS